MTTPAMPRPAPPAKVVYPDSDGEPMADNTEQFEWIQVLQGNLDALVPDFVAGDHLWYPVEGHPEIRVAPDVYVALGRPKGHRGSYKQWEEGGIPPRVVFEIQSPKNTFQQMMAKYRFYERYGVEEYYLYDPDRHQLNVWVRRAGELVPVSTEAGWTSPLLGVSFQLDGEELIVRGPDGERFKTFKEVRDGLAAAKQAAAEAERRAEAERERAEAERQRAEALAARLRSLGIDPNAG